MILLRLHLSLVVIASSYLTLGVAAPEKARDLWWQYAGVTLILSLASLVYEWRCRDRDPKEKRR
jgi:hypothetical protein